MGYAKIVPQRHTYLDYYDEANRVLRFIHVVDDYTLDIIPDEAPPDILFKAYDDLTVKNLYEDFNVPLHPEAGQTYYDQDGNPHTIQSEYWFDELNPNSRYGLTPSWIVHATKLFTYRPGRIWYRSVDNPRPYPKPLDPTWQPEPIPAWFTKPTWRIPVDPFQAWVVLYTQEPSGGAQIVRIWADYVSLLQTKSNDQPYMENSIIEAFVHPGGDSRMLESKGINDSYEDSWLWILEQTYNHWPWRRVMRWAWLTGNTAYFDQYYHNGYPWIDIQGYEFRHPSISSEEQEDDVIPPPLPPIPMVIEGFSLLLPGFTDPGGLFGIKIDDGDDRY